MASRTLLIDTLGYTGSRGGTETYVRHIVPRLGALLPDVRIVVAANRSAAERVRAFAPGEVVALDRVSDSAASWAWGTVVETPRLARRLDADLIWCPANFGPVRSAVPTVLTLHDTIYHSVPGHGAARITRALTGALSAAAAHHASHLISGSEAAVADIGRHMGIGPESITVIPHGSTPPASAVPAGARERLGVPKGRDVVLSIGNAMPHKNLAGLVRAVANLPDERRPYTIIIGGGVPELLLPLIEELGVGHVVSVPGWVSSTTLDDAYAAADLYACVSLLEGFGLPLLDAMHRSIPVLAHDIPVLREVGADVALYADASSPADFGRAIATSLGDRDTLRARAARGPGRAALFTWDKAASETAHVLGSQLAAAR